MICLQKKQATKAVHMAESQSKNGNFLQAMKLMSEASRIYLELSEITKNPQVNFNYICLFFYNLFIFL